MLTDYDITLTWTITISDGFGPQHAVQAAQGLARLLTGQPVGPERLTGQAAVATICYRNADQSPVMLLASSPGPGVPAEGGFVCLNCGVLRPIAVLDDECPGCREKAEEKKGEKDE